MPVSMNHQNANDPPEAGRPQEGFELIPQSPKPISHLGKKGLHDSGWGRSNKNYLAQLQRTTSIVPGAIDQGQ